MPNIDKNISSNNNNNNIEDLVKELNNVLNTDITDDNQEKWYKNIFHLLNEIQNCDLDYMENNDKEK